MRWAAALAVFLLHINNFGYFGAPGDAVVRSLFGSGGTGVSFFFILSGFIMAWTARADDTAWRFWRRRVARIYPVHLVAALLAFVLSITLVPELLPTGPVEVGANLLLISSWNHDWWQALDPVSWSLCCEAFFYALFPLAYFLLRRKGTRFLYGFVLVGVVTVVTIPAISSVVVLPFDPYSFPLARLPEFLIGVGLGLVVRSGAWSGPPLWAASALALIGYVLSGLVTAEYGFACFTVIGFALLICAGAAADLNGTGSLWRSRGMVRLGELSFAFYMVHLLVLWLVRSFFPWPRLPPLPAIALTVGVLIAALALAWVTSELVEVPCRRLLLADTRLLVQTQKPLARHSRHAGRVR